MRPDVSKVFSPSRPQPKRALPAGQALSSKPRFCQPLLTTPALSQYDHCDPYSKNCVNTGAMGGGAGPTTIEIGPLVIFWPAPNVATVVSVCVPEAAPFHVAE